MRNNKINIQLFADPASQEDVETIENDIDIDDDNYDDGDDDYLDEDDDDFFSGVDDLDDSQVDEGDTDGETDDTDGVDDSVGTGNSSPITREELAKAIAEAREEGIRHGRVNAFIGKTNQYTGEPIKDGADLSIYEMMQKIESEGGDPINDLHKHIAGNLRGKQEAKAAAMQHQAHTKKDVTAFATKHPDVKISELMADKDFMMMAEGRLGSVPLTVIYDSYVAVKSRIGETAERNAKSIVAKQKASPGTLKGTGRTETKVDESKLYEAMLRGTLG